MNYEPGTFAVIGWTMTSGEERAIFNGTYWSTESGIGVGPERVTDVRPLVVLDLTPDETEATLHVLGDAACDFENDGAVHSLAVINRLRDQIREQTRPPKPEVYEHLTAGLSNGVAHGLCGKVWTPSEPDAVTVLGRCPDCVTHAEGGWIA